MFPSQGSRGLYNWPYTSPASPRLQLNLSAPQIYMNNSKVPEGLPVYQWTPTPIPTHTTISPVITSRKRQYIAESPHHVKRQRVQTYHSDDIVPSFESSPLPQSHCSTNQINTWTSQGTIQNLYYHSSPPAETTSSPQSTQDKVSAQMIELFQACQQQTSDLYRKESFREQLQKDIRRLYPDARLYMTGSTMSGLGCRSSDADFCLVIGIKNSYAKIIDALSALLRFIKTLSYVDRVMLIKAKVPILRFKEKGSNLEFDLNVNNTVGIRNTFLLKSYTTADSRIRPLMLVIKKWARHCEINDASKGTLSSYALALMALNYLQIVKPPVLPSLQRDHPAYFYPSLELDMVPSSSQWVPLYKSRNQTSLGRLFLGFLKYYASDFRWDKEIISVREARTFVRKDSLHWRDKFICVEEPFERHNVARAVHEKDKFDTIKAKFAESYKILNEKKDLNSLLPMRVIIQKEQEAGR